MDRGDGKIDYAAFAANLHERDAQTNDVFKFDGHAADMARPGKGGFVRP